MKTLSIAVLAASLLAGPVLAQQTPTAQATPAAAIAPANRTDLSKNWTTGQKVPSAYTGTSRYIVYNPEEYGLTKPAFGNRWLVVGDNAYLVRDKSDIIIRIVGVTPKT